MKYVVGVLLALAPARALAGGAFACTDACTRDPRTGMSCDDMGLGCNPSTRVCQQCSDDIHCLPNGTCVDFMCVGLICTYDAGADGGDASPMDAEDGGDPMDADPIDAEPDAAPEDAAPIDVAFPDARDPTIPLGGPRGTTPPKDPFDDDKCGCTTAHRGGSALWILIGLAVFQRKWFRTRLLSGKTTIL